MLRERVEAQVWAGYCANTSFPAIIIYAEPKLLKHRPLWQTLGVPRTSLQPPANKEKSTNSATQTQNSQPITETAASNQRGHVANKFLSKP